MLPSEDNMPVVLLLGDVLLAKAEWNSLRAIAELRVRGLEMILTCIHKKKLIMWHG